MPMRSFIPNPVQAQQYKAGDAKQSDELSKSLGLSFQPDSNQMTDAQGNTYAISDGDYVGVSSEGTTRIYGAEYFESRFTELNSTAVKAAK